MTNFIITILHLVLSFTEASQDSQDVIVISDDDNNSASSNESSDNKQNYVTLEHHFWQSALQEYSKVIIFILNFDNNSIFNIYIVLHVLIPQFSIFSQLNKFPENWYFSQENILN